MRQRQAIVVGGGLAGIAAAVAVAKSGLQTLHLAPKGPPDRRTSALMLPSVEYLQVAGLIGEPAAAFSDPALVDAILTLVSAVAGFVALLGRLAARSRIG